MKSPLLLLLAMLQPMAACQKTPKAIAKPPAAPARVCGEGDKTADSYVITGDGNAIGYTQWWYDAPSWPLRVLPYPAKCVNGQLVEDEEAMQAFLKEQQAAHAEALAEEARRHALWNALRTRVLTDDELAKVLEYDTQIVPASEVDEHSASAAVILNNALKNQFEMRLAAKKEGVSR